MRSNLQTERFQRRLNALTRKWWFYALIVLLFLLPTYASEPHDRRQSVELVGLVLSAPLINALPALMPIAKLVPVVLIIGLLAYGNRLRRAFSIYVALLYLAISLLQNAAVTERYGLVVLTGNLAVVLLVALVWLWEVLTQATDFERRKRPWRRWWVVPLAAVALLAPVDVSTMSPDFRPLRLLTNEAGLTFCMMTPVVLAVLTLFHPTVNPMVLRITGMAGLLFGAVNLVTWFVMEPWGWWMGVLHIPLLVLSVYALALARARVPGVSSAAGVSPPTG